MYQNVAQCINAIIWRLRKAMPCWQTYSIDLYSKNILRIFSASKRQKIKNIEPESEKQYSSKKKKSVDNNTKFMTCSCTCFWAPACQSKVDIRYALADISGHRFHRRELTGRLQKFPLLLFSFPSFSSVRSQLLRSWIYEVLVRLRVSSTQLPIQLDVRQLCHFTRISWSQKRGSLFTIKVLAFLLDGFRDMFKNQLLHFFLLKNIYSRHFELHTRDFSNDLRLPFILNHFADRFWRILFYILKNSKKVVILNHVGNRKTVKTIKPFCFCDKYSREIL